jgi:hypothetical protein
VSWVKSSFSNGNGGNNCVEVDRTPLGDLPWVCVRDSKDPGGPVLTFTQLEWAAFVKGVKAGEFD